MWIAGRGAATLRIERNDVHDRGAAHVARIIESGCLRALFADDNGIGARGFGLIASAVSCAASRLQLLHANNNNATAVGAAALFRSLALPAPVHTPSPNIKTDY